jgi:hypothetical protein
LRYPNQNGVVELARVPRQLPKMLRLWFSAIDLPQFARAKSCDAHSCRPFLYRCPITGLNVQGFIAEEIRDDPKTFEAVTCTVCGRTHLINLKTGRVQASRMRAQRPRCKSASCDRAEAQRREGRRQDRRRQGQGRREDVRRLRQGLRRDTPEVSLEQHAFFGAREETLSCGRIHLSPHSGGKLLGHLTGVRDVG